MWGIEIINEPSIDLFGLKLARFYRRAYKQLTKVARPGTHIVFSDAYAPLRTSNCFWLSKQPDFPVVMDCHIYQVFDDKSQKRTFNQSIKRLKYTKWLLRLLRFQQSVVIGEWSAMLPTKTTTAQTQQYILSQLQAFSSTEVEFYWNYKTEANGRWNYRDLIAQEVIQ